MENRKFHSIKIVREFGTQNRHVYVDGNEMRVCYADISYGPGVPPTVWLCVLTDDVEIDEPEATIDMYSQHYFEYEGKKVKRVMIDGKRDDDGLEREQQTCDNTGRTEQ